LSVLVDNLHHYIAQVVAAGLHPGPIRSQLQFVRPAAVLNAMVPISLPPWYATAFTSLRCRGCSPADGAD
jgi:hypothetical protein